MIAAAAFVATAALATISGIITIGETLPLARLSPTLCENNAFKQSDINEESDDDTVEDPMSTYAISAIIRELKQQHEQQQQLKESCSADSAPTTKSATASVQATSSTGNGALQDPYPLNPSDAFLDISNISENEAKIEEAARKAKQHSGGLKIFSGNGNMSLALEICRHLGVNLGKATVGRFADGEVNVVIHENVRGKDVYIVQPTCPPVNDNMMELLLMVSTLRRSSARRITVVIPYYGYARQDRKMQVRFVFRSCSM
jgi:hypothetical protein